MGFRVALVRPDVLGESVVSIIKVERISKLGTTCVVQSLVTANFVPSSLILSTLMVEVIYSSETPVLARVTRRHIPEDSILHRHRRKNHRFYIVDV
jgi:hypothetical protein